MSHPSSVHAGRQFTLLIVVVVTLAVPHGLANEVTEATPLWSIGAPDGSSIEFAPGSRPKLDFVIGSSVAARDFAGHHEGTIGSTGAESGEKPYAIEFELPAAPADDCRLVLDLIYTYGAPQQLRITVNGAAGVFPILPTAKKDVDSFQGNMALLSGQRLVAVIPKRLLRHGANRLALAPQGVGALDYDALAFYEAASAPEQSFATPRLAPTQLYTETAAGLAEQRTLLVPFSQRFESGRTVIQISGKNIDAELDAGDCEFGVISQPVAIPAQERPQAAEIAVTLDDQTTRARVDFVPAKRWKIYVCPKVHNDVGFTDYQPHVNELDTRNTDVVLSILRKYPFYKFNFETAWLVDNYLDCRPEKYRQELVARCREDRAAVNAFYLNLLTGICTGEELYRSMYFAHELHRTQGTGFEMACLTDAPSHTWFLPTLLNDVGITAFANGSNQARAPILVLSDLNEQSPFQWEGMNGERVLMWYARSYAQLKMLTAQGYISPREGYGYFRATLPQFLSRYLQPEYIPDAVMVYGAYVDNAAIPETGEAEYIEQWNREFAYPRLIVATDADYFRYIKASCGERLPTYRGDAGAYWEDGVASSAAATACNRHTQQLLPAAETSSSFATMMQPRFRYPAEDFRAAWKNVLFYDEHTWGAYNSISQPDRPGAQKQWEVKESYARRANLDARTLNARSLNRLCQQITVKQNTIFAFNWQNRQRSQPLEVDLDDAAELIDLSTNQPVELDVLHRHDGFKQVRFMAKDVPAMGYRGYEARSPLPPPADPTAKQESRVNGAGARSGVEQDHPEAWTLAGTHYRLTVDPATGGLSSLIDRATGRELVEQDGPYALNQYLYVSGGAESLILDLKFGSAPADLTIAPPTGAHVVEKIDGPLGQRIVVETTAPNTPRLRCEYRLYNDLRRVDIVNTLTKTATRDKEAVYFAFPFAADEPEFEYQIQNGWVRPNEDQLPGACREWFATQNLVQVRDGQASAVLACREAPLVTLVDVNRGKWPQRLEAANGRVFSYVMNNYWFTNYRAEQGGEFTFYYSVTSGEGLSRADVANFDADTRSPILAYPYISSFSASVAQGERPLDAASGSFLSLDEPNLQLVGVKAAEDGHGYIVRLLETAGQAGDATLALPHVVLQAAHLCNGVEVNQRELTASAGEVSFPYQPHRFTTLRLIVGEDEP
ncbi:MAG: hypothetical protein KDA44_12930 [Planctomycetales bacterium]|nr:hypothetical protein [Planctomycetales bacterium]